MSTFLLEPQAPQKIIVAAFYRVAAKYARSEGLRPGDWAYARTADDIRGRYREDVVIVEPIFFLTQSPSGAARLVDIMNLLDALPRRKAVKA